MASRGPIDDFVGILRSINLDNITRDYFSNSGTHGM